MSDDGMSEALAEVSLLWHLLIFSLSAFYKMRCENVLFVFITLNPGGKVIGETMLTLQVESPHH